MILVAKLCIHEFNFIGLVKSTVTYNHAQIRKHKELILYNFNKH